MRPLEHLGAGINSPDYDLYENNELLYDNLLARSNTILADAYKKFMDHYVNKPDLTKSELEKLLDKRLQEKNYLINLKATSELLNTCDEAIVEIYKLIESKNYAKPSDPVYKQYCKVREKKLKEWYKSDILKNLTTEIQQYNEAEYNKFKQESSGI